MALPEGGDINLWKRGNRRDRVLLFKVADGSWLTEDELKTKRKRVAKAKLKAAAKFIGIGKMFGMGGGGLAGVMAAAKAGGGPPMEEGGAAAAPPVMEGSHNAADEDENHKTNAAEQLVLQDAEEPRKESGSPKNILVLPTKVAEKQAREARFDRFIQNLTLLPDSPPDRVHVYAFRSDQNPIFSLTAPGKAVSSKKIIAQLEMKFGTGTGR